MGHVGRIGITPITLLSLFVLGQLFFTIKQVEMTPWVHWGMYSSPVKPRLQYKAIQISVNGVELAQSRLTDFQHERLLGPLERYLHLKDAENQQPVESLIRSKRGNWPVWLSDVLTRRLVLTNEQLGTFPGWYAHHLEQFLGREVHQVRVSELYTAYDSSGLPTLQAVQETVLFDDGTLRRD